MLQLVGSVTVDTPGFELFSLIIFQVVCYIFYIIMRMCFPRDIKIYC